MFARGSMHACSLLNKLKSFLLELLCFRVKLMFEWGIFFLYKKVVINCHGGVRGYHLGISAKKWKRSYSSFLFRNIFVVLHWVLQTKRNKSQNNQSIFLILLWWFKPWRAVSIFCCLSNWCIQANCHHQFLLNKVNFYGEEFGIVTWSSFWSQNQFQLKNKCAVLRRNELLGGHGICC